MGDEDPHGSAPMTVRGQVTQLESGGYRLVLTVGTSDRSPVTREIEAASCDELVDAAALILTVGAEPASAVPNPTGPKPQPEHVIPTVRTEALPAVEDPEPPPPRSRWALSPVLGLGGNLTTPLSWGVGMQLAWMRGAARIELEAFHHFERSVRLQDGNTVGHAYVSLTPLSIRGCGVPRTRRLEFPLCGGLSFAPMRGRAEGRLARSSSATQLWAAGSASVGLTVPFTRHIGLALAVEGIVPFVRPAFAIEGLPEILRAPPLGGVGRLALEIRVP